VRFRRSLLEALGVSWPRGSGYTDCVGYGTTDENSMVWDKNQRGWFASVVFSWLVSLLLLRH